MARRPDIFNQQAFEESLRQLGCAESFVKPITSDYRLFIPIVMRELGEEKLFEMINNAREELRLGDQDPAWREACKYIVKWSENEIEKYISRK
ncbi:MAG: hypothetical protein Q8N39_06235 [Pelolinea sp.]|nr:hypothetical protein [Pelolinea sp.]